jgi:large subunit ribosomal protein L24
VAVSRIRKDDEVVVIAGKDVGKHGKVLSVDPVKGRAIVEGVNMVRKAVKPSQVSPQGGLIDREAALAVSNLMPFDPVAKKGVRISRSRDGKATVRTSKKSTHVFD